jgi:hypothetical protein
MRSGGLDDFEFPIAGRGNHGSGVRSLITSIGEGALEQRKEARSSIENQSCAIAIPQVGGMHSDTQEGPSVSTRICRLRQVTFLPASRRAPLGTQSGRRDCCLGRDKIGTYLLNRQNQLGVVSNEQGYKAKLCCAV